MTSTTSSEPDTRRLLVLVGIIALAVNLRTAISSVGAVLDEVSSGVHLSGPEAGLLTTLPVLCFASVGALAPRLARTFGLHRVSFAGLVLVTAAVWARAQVDSGVLFLVLSFLALTGAATSNVLLPSLVKLHFPDRVGVVTAIYTTAMAIGLTASSVLTVPLGTVDGHLDWRRALVVWAAIAAIAALPWLGLLGHDRSAPASPHRWGLADVARTRLGWAMAVFFGLQSLQAYSVFGWFAKIYRDAGFSPGTAGALLGVITGVSIPLSLLIPVIAGRMRDQRLLVAAVIAFYPIGYLGLLVAPRGGAWVWAVAIGIGACTFPLILTMIGLRAATPAGTAALSGFAQSVGYLIAATGPFLMGLLHSVTGGWTMPLWMLLLLTVPQLLIGLYAARPVVIEDELRAA